MKITRRAAPILVIVIVLIIIAVLASHKGGEGTTTSFIGSSEKAVLKLSPSSGEHEVGETFPVKIILDTKSNKIVGTDIHFLKYPPDILEVEDSSSSTPGTQIMAGSLLPNTTSNLVFPELGRIDFSQVSAPKGYYQGNGVLATIYFKAKKKGKADISFDFSAGKTTDSNVAGNDGTDILSGVQNGEYQIREVPKKYLRIKVKPEGRGIFSQGKVKIKILWPGTSNIALEKEVRSDNNGVASLDLSGLQNNKWDIAVFVPGYLKKEKDNVSISEGNNNLEFRDILAGNLQDSDEIINSLDWSVMNSQWGRTDKPRADINQDGIVNSLDWSFLKKNWGRSAE